MPADDAPAVLTIGETMVLVTPCDPVPLSRAVDFHLDAGGAESNVASHLAALGVRAAWVSSVGDDALGDRLLQTLADRGVDARWVDRSSHAPTGVYFKDPGNSVIYHRAGSAASQMGPSKLDDLPLHDVSIMHLTGITPALSHSCAELVDRAVALAHEAGALVSFDVNHRPALWRSLDEAAVTLRNLAERADLVFVGQDEAERLWGCASACEVRTLLSDVDALIVKEGDVGATGFHGDEELFEPAIPTQVVEVVGAGDAFAAGYLAALLRGASPTARLRAGHERAQVALSSTGDFAPTPVA